MFRFKSSSYLKIKKRNSNYTRRKLQCINLEKEIFNFINLIRREPSKIIEYFQKAKESPNYNENFETYQIFNFINILIENDISLPPLIEKKELSKISLDLLNYLINIKKTQGRIKYNNLDEEYINFRKRAAPYGRIRGKYYEAIVLESTDLLEIISYIMKDIKGRNVLFNEKIKYIGIACGFFENRNNKICTIIDLVQDFELNDLIENNNNYSNIMNETYENRNPEIFMRIKTDLKDNDEIIKNHRVNTKKNLSFDRNSKNFDRVKKCPKLMKDSYDIEFNKRYDKRKIIVNKTPLLANNSNFNKTYSSNFFFSKTKSNSSNLKPPLASYKLIIPKKKISTLKNGRNNFSSHQNFNKLNEKSNLINTTNDNSLEKYEVYSACFSRNKNLRKKLNREEKIELLQKINKASRDKSKKSKSKSNMKSEDDSKSVSFTNTKKNISNDASFSELISFDNERKIKDEKEIRNILKEQIKNEIKKEMKEAKEELKSEIVNRMLLTSSNRYMKTIIPNLTFNGVSQ